MTEFNEDFRFSTFLGFQFEGEGSSEGLRQIIYFKENKPIIRKKDAKTSSLEKLYKTLSPKDVLSIPSFTKIVIFASTEFGIADIEELSERLDECELSRDERRDFESRLRELRTYDGVTCTLELAFDLGGRLYVYEVQPDWYEEFLNLEEEVSAHLPDGEDYDAGDSLGGYFSKN